jgi:GntR family transcriptional regulator, trigonelline degradation regulator
MPLVARKLVPSSLRQQIAQEIRQAILNRSLAPGERLVERELAARLGASLSVTREALIQLEMEGLIIKKPNATTHVTQLSREDVEQVFAVRRILERFAFQEAARKASAAHIQRLVELHEKAKEAATAVDFQWHEAVWQAAGNQCLLETLKRVALPLFGFSAIRVATQEGFDLMHDTMTHAPLLKAIQARNPEAAAIAFDGFVTIWERQSLDASDPAKIAGAPSST